MPLAKRRRKFFRDVESRLVSIRSSDAIILGATPTIFTVDVNADIAQRVHAVELESISFPNIQNNISTGRDTLTFLDDTGLVETAILIGTEEYLPQGDYLARIVTRIEAAVPLSAPVSASIIGTISQPILTIDIAPAASSQLAALLGIDLAKELGYTAASTTGPTFTAQDVSTMDNPLTSVNVVSDNLTQMNPNIKGNGQLSNILTTIPITNVWGTYSTYVREVDTIPDSMADDRQMYHLEHIDIKLTDQNGRTLTSIAESPNISIVLRIWY